MPIQTPPSADYIKRINAAIDHIVQHIGVDLQLEDVARIACFSPFHFHRIFSSLMGETVKQFVKRLRLERSVYLMSHSPTRSLTDIALECGFGSSSDFSRSFKARYGVPPSAFDLANFRETQRDKLQEILANQDSPNQLTRLPTGANSDDFEIKLHSLPPRTVAYIRIRDSFQDDAVVRASARLVEWAREHGWENGKWLGYMWDDPEIVELADCRYDVGVVLPPAAADAFQAKGEVGRLDFPEMLVAEITIRGDIHLEQRAIDWLYQTWLPTSGFEPDDQPAFEVWHGKPFEHGEAHFELDCHLPVRPLAK